MRACPLIFAAFLLIGTAFAQQCQQAKFKGRVNGGEDFVQALGTGIEFRLRAAKDEGGWELSVNPLASDDDWAYVVTPPLRFGNAEYLANGYGETVRDQLARQHEIRFVLNAATYERIFKLVQDALWPYSAKDPDNAAPAYLAALHDTPSGLLVLNPTEYDKLGASDQVGWMEFAVTVTVPKTFAGSKDLKWTAAACPPPAS
jgi:hypothetical protein